MVHVLLKYERLHLEGVPPWREGRRGCARRYHRLQRGAAEGAGKGTTEEQQVPPSTLHGRCVS